MQSRFRDIATKDSRQHGGPHRASLDLEAFRYVWYDRFTERESSPDQ